MDDSNALLAAMAEIDVNEADEVAQAALGLLALLAGQDVEPADGSDGTDGRWRTGRPGRRGSGDLDGGHRCVAYHKSPENRRNGFWAHVAADPETGIITDEKLTKAAGPENADPAVAAEFARGEGEPRVWYGDSAYVTGDLRDVIQGRDDNQSVLKPKPLHAPVPGGFTVDDFTIDEHARDQPGDSIKASRAARR